ncbi:MAG: hypothetical protein AAGF78_10985 [Pseudomonadota bacterium]
MKKVLVPAVVVGVIFGTSAAAQQITGGEVELSYQTYTDTDVDQIGLNGAIEVGFSRNLGVQADLGFNSLSDGADDVSITNFTLHGLFHSSQTTSFGGYLGQNHLSNGTSETVEHYGIEAGFEFGTSDLEIFLGQISNSGEDATEFGIEYGRMFMDALEITGAIDVVNFDGGVTTARYGIRGDYEVRDGIGVFGGLSQVEADTPFGGATSELNIVVGATYTFGDERGATFGSRGSVGGGFFNITR